MHPVLVDVLLATVPAFVLAAVTWRVVWPRWKLVGKLLLLPLVYFGLALLFGLWRVPVAWLHQGLGLAGQVRFSQKLGFTWFAVEDPERYVALSKASIDEWARGLRKDG
jgi:hypothetical protein